MPVKDKPKKMQAKEAFVFFDGARAPVYQTAVVRDRHTGRLAEVPLNPEAPPLDPGTEGHVYVFAKGEQVWDDHPVVQARPMYFVDAD